MTLAVTQPTVPPPVSFSVTQGGESTLRTNRFGATGEIRK